MLLRGGCHCENIRFELDWRGDPEAIPARACGCSFCLKHGGVWTANASSKLTVFVADDALVSRYQFGTRTAVFHVCARCGVPAVVTSEIDGKLYAVVNVNAFEGVGAAKLARKEVSFDGETTEARLARRTRGWIAEVTFA